MPTVLEPVVIKGTRHGLLASVREDAEFDAALAHLKSKFTTDSGFLRGATLSFDFGWREVAPDEFTRLEETLKAHEVTLIGILSTSLNTRNVAESRGYKAIIGRLGLAEHQGRAIRRRQFAPAPAAVSEPSEEPLPPEPEEAVEEPVLEARRDGDLEPTLYHRRTLRSGQEVIFAGNVVVLGDVNPGAAIEAEGDVIVMGNLRGAVHAGSSGNPDAQVMWMGQHPTQVRIADTILSLPTNGKRNRNGGPHKALLRGGQVQLEPFSSR